MEEMYLDTAMTFAAILFGLFAFNTLFMGKNWRSVPLFLKLAALPSIAIIFVTMTYYKKKKLPRYEVVRHLEHVETLTPKYIYGYNKYAVEFHEREILIERIKGYSTDSAAVVDKVQVYRQVRLPIWGLIKPHFADEYLFSLKMTPNIERGLKQAEQVELKEETSK